MAGKLALTRNAHLKDAALAPAQGLVKSALDQLFVFLFQGFVYNQIWEDPEVDMEGLEIGPNSRILTIASGGCNVLNYLTAGPEKIVAVDLNPHHMSLTRLKLAALKNLPDEETFFAFFGYANLHDNLETYKTYLRDNLDETTRKHWEKRAHWGRKRITLFERNLYRHSLLGHFIGLVHLISKVQRQDPRVLLSVRTPEQQRTVYQDTIGYLFDTKFVRWLCSLPVSFYALGIPPSQYKELEAASDGGNPATLFKERIERLACDFPIESNYFAWQAFGRGYDTVRREAVPPYLKKGQFQPLKEMADRVETHLTTLTKYLRDQPAMSLNGYVLLDSQDWMTDVQLADLWTEINRTAEPGARVIFRTAGHHSPLEEKLGHHLLEDWDVLEERGEELTKKDRSSIYGAFHIYQKKA